MIGVTITPSHIDYSKIITPAVVENILIGECIILAGYSKELVPVDKGQLKNSIMWAISTKSGGFNEGIETGTPGKLAAPFSAWLKWPKDSLTGYVGSGLEYAGAVEYGRSDMPSYPRQPYFRPAIDYSKKQREARQKGIIRTAIQAAYHG
jgi:hypothetical protein